MSVRVIEYSVRDDDGVSEAVALITTVLDPGQAPAIELARIYADRWHALLVTRMITLHLLEPEIT
ncbi:hypothetical protein ACWD62_16195 [Streptomyces sp. NPDC005146]